MLCMWVIDSGFKKCLVSYTFSLWESRRYKSHSIRVHMVKTTDGNDPQKSWHIMMSSENNIDILRLIQSK